jgi:hypothetical protein
VTPAVIAASLETALNLVLRLDPELFPRLGRAERSCHCNRTERHGDDLLSVAQA